MTAESLAPVRLVALVASSDIHPASRQLRGLPPSPESELDGEAMPWPRVLVIQAKRSGIFLDRFSEDGVSGGDTWHLSIEDAKHQAEEEYNGLLSDWRAVPPELADDAVIPFALATEA